MTASRFKCSHYISWYVFALPLLCDNIFLVFFRKFRCFFRVKKWGRTLWLLFFCPTLTPSCFLRSRYRRRSAGAREQPVFPNGYSKIMCVSACTQKAPNLRCGFLKRRLTNTPRRHRLADGQLSPLYASLPTFSSFGAASVKMCCSARPAYSSAPSALPEDRIGLKYHIHCLIL